VGAKLTQKDFIQRSLAVHNSKYDYSKSIYISSHSKLIIICSKHGDFQQIPSSHMSGHGCHKCYHENQSIAKEEFINRSNKKHNRKYNYSLVKSFKTSDTVIIICPYHGKFEQKIKNHLSGYGGCKQCYTDNYHYNENTFIKKSNEVHNNKYNYSLINFIKLSEYIIIICKNHGKFKTTGANHLSGYGCVNCANDSKKNSLDDFISVSNVIHKHKYNYSLVKYINNNSYIDIICPTHGSFKQKPRNHSGGFGCKQCSVQAGNGTKSISKGETQWLNDLNILDKNRQIIIKLNYCNYIVDGFDITTNTVYEFYGDFYHGNPKYYKSTKINAVNKKLFGELYQNTLNREDVLLQNGYNVAYIWESDFKAGKPFTLRSSHNKLDQYKGIK